MECFKTSFFLFNNNKNSNKIKFLYYVFILLNTIETYNSISTEITRISNPYPTLNTLRNLSEQYIYGSSFKLNYFYSNLYFGEDMQKQGLILDTGSSITTATCSPLCQKCGHHICPPYDIKNQKKIISCSDPKCKMVSSNCNSNSVSNCAFSISYSEGSSLRGVFINELIRFGINYTEQEGKYIPIGCTMSENHLFFKQEVNGIMGLSNNDYNFVELLYKLGAIKRNVFSLCYAQLGGVFTIGEINDKLHTEKITYLPMETDRIKYFGLTINSIYVNDKKVTNFNKGKFTAFIDSGTTISYFNNHVCDEIVALMKEECSKLNKKESCGKYEYHSDFGYCYYFNNTNDLDYAVKHYWPTFHFNLEGYDYKWTPERYVFNASTKNRSGACIGFNYNTGNRFTLGASWIIGHDIIFDREKKLLGFAEADCYQNKILNKTNGLEINIKNYDPEKNYENSKKEKIKKVSFVIVIIANILLISLVILIIWIILQKNNSKKLEKELQLKIKEHNNEYIKNEKRKNDKDNSYIKVLDDSSRGNKL